MGRATQDDILIHIYSHQINQKVFFVFSLMLFSDIDVYLGDDSDFV